MGGGLGATSLYACEKYGIVMKFSILLLFVSLLIFGCDNTTSPNQLCSKKNVLIDSTLFINGANDGFLFKKVELIEDCLKLTIQYGGGCGEVVVNLFDSGALAKSLPPQRYIRLSLEDNDSCEALITKDYIFNLSPLRVNNTDIVKLNLTNWDEQLVYSY